MPGPLEVKVEPWGPDPDRVAEAAQAAVRDGARLRLTREGMLLANEIMAVFV